MASAKEDERKFILEVIELYHSLPALWKIKSEEYHNKSKKNQQYEQLLSKYKEKYPNANKANLIKKINSLRTNFRKELTRIKNSEKSGAGIDDIEEPTLWYFDEMKFLIGQEEPSTSQSSMESQVEGNEDDSDASRVNNTIKVNIMYICLYLVHVFVLYKFILP